jgi:phosphopantetheinyl transferase (holo-ACP synthase)
MRDVTNSVRCRTDEPSSYDFFSVSIGQGAVHIVAEEFRWTNGHRTARHDKKPILVCELWRRYRFPQGNNSKLGELTSTHNIELVSDDFGKPVLLVNGQVGPAVSFSYSGTRLWASLGLQSEYLGLDAALPSDFGLDYPFHRVFGDEEYRRCLELTGSCPSEAAALLWSAKEAAVKAAGSGFRLFGPLDVEVYPNPESSSGLEFSGQIPKAGRVNAKIANKGQIVIKSFKNRTEWISIAVVATGE